MSLRRRNKRRRKIRLARRLVLPALFLVFIFSVFASGYLYFFESRIKANHFFHKAQKLDEANPNGSREAIKYYTRAIASYVAIGDRGATVNAYISLGLLHHKFGNIIQVERMVLNAINIGGDDIPKPMKAKAYMLLASTVEHESAKNYINQALIIADELDQKILAVKSYIILAKIYEYNASFEEAKSTYLKAIKIVEKLEPKDGSFNAEPLYANLGELYEGEGSTSNAIIYYEKALTAEKAHAEHSLTAATHLTILGNLYQAHMQPAKACKKWHDSKEEYIILGKEPPAALIKLSQSNNC